MNSGIGAFNNYVDIILPFSDPPAPARGQFLNPERGQKQTLFDPLPPHLVHVVIECPHTYQEGFKLWLILITWFFNFCAVVVF